MRATIPGTNIAKAHVTQVSCIAPPVDFEIYSRTSGLGAVAVTNIADEIGLA